MSDSKILELVSLLPPPEECVATEIDWDVVEADLGLPLPTDYKEFIRHYGNVDLCGVIYVFHPYEKANCTSQRQASIKLLNDTINVVPTGRQHLRYPDYPAVGGILPIAHIYEHLLCWITEGHPDSWRLLHWAEFGEEVTEYKMSLTEFLIEIFNERMEDIVGSFFVGRDSPNRQAKAVPITEFWQAPGEEYYRNQKNGD